MIEVTLPTRWKFFDLKNLTKKICHIFNKVCECDITDKIVEDAVIYIINLKDNSYILVYKLDKKGFVKFYSFSKVIQMPSKDITLCVNDKCSLRKECLRYTMQKEEKDKTSKETYSHTCFKPTYLGCKYYIPVINKNKK